MVKTPLPHSEQTRSPPSQPRAGPTPPKRRQLLGPQVRKSDPPCKPTALTWQAEFANPTRYQGQLGVYVRPRGRVGAAYMALIRPFRHRVVYPALMRQIERAWNATRAQRTE